MILGSSNALLNLSHVANDMIYYAWMYLFVYLPCQIPKVDLEVVVRVNLIWFIISLKSTRSTLHVMLATIHCCLLGPELVLLIILPKQVLHILLRFMPHSIRDVTIRTGFLVSMYVKVSSGVGNTLSSPIAYGYSQSASFWAYAKSEGKVVSMVSCWGNLRSHVWILPSMPHHFAEPFHCEKMVYSRF